MKTFLTLAAALTLPALLSACSASVSDQTNMEAGSSSSVMEETSSTMTSESGTELNEYDSSAAIMNEEESSYDPTGDARD